MIKEIITKILNALTFTTFGKEIKAVCILVSVCIVACLLLCFIMVDKIPTKFAFFVDSISLPTKKVTIGEGSDISFKGVPKDYLEVFKDGDTIKWNVNKKYHDSDTLQYFKINNSNPNAICIQDNDKQTIIVEIPSSIMGNSTTMELRINGSDIWREWDEFKDQKEILLRNFAVRYQSERTEYDAKDTLGFMQQKKVRSFLSHKDDSIKLVILDLHTRVETQNDDKGTVDITKYTFNGQCSSGNACKVQFCKVTDFCYLDKDDDATFSVNGINYVMKTGIKLTEWGAGHVMMNFTKESCDVFYPKALGYVETLDTLEEMAKKSGGIVNLKQSDVTYPNKNDIYLPQFSSQIPIDICTLEFHDGKLFRKKDHSDSTMVTSEWNIVPKLEPFKNDTGYGAISGRIGYIDKPFIFGYIILPLSIALILIIFILSPISPVAIASQTPYRLYNRDKLLNYRWFFATLIGIAFCYCLCKIMIVLKLSYTYPYFEKLTGIVPVSTSLMLLFFFTVAMILNTPLVRAVAWQNKKSGQMNAYPYSLVITILVLFAVTICYFAFVLDPAVNDSVKSSYFKSEVFTLNILKWMSPSDVPGINDTHRSVIYVLILFEGMALLIWMALLCFWDKFMAKTKILANKARKFRVIKTELVNLWDKFEDGAISAIQKLVPMDIEIRKPKLEFDSPDRKLKFKEWIGYALGRLPLSLVLFCIGELLIVIFRDSNSLLPTLVLAVVSILVLALKVINRAFVATIDTLCSWHLLLLVMFIVIGGINGNFGTAFITLGVIIGLTSALCSVRFDNPDTPEQEGLQPLEGMWYMLFITAAYIICAMTADNGYLTNYIGFFVCFLVFYFLFEIPGWNNLLARQIRKKTTRHITAFLIVLVAILVFLPYICSQIYNPNEVHYDRMARRLMLFSDFDNLQESGYRYAETDAEFMVVMSHSMQQENDEDPLSNDLHMLHPSISTGQSPVVLNDLSLPSAFFGSYGKTISTFVFFLLLISLLCLISQYSIPYEPNGEPRLYHQVQWRLMAVMMWVGTTLYIYSSYIGFLPFTGRLIPGFGVDSVGEALETSLLFAFMSSVAFVTDDFGIGKLRRRRRQ